MQTFPWLTTLVVVPLAAAVLLWFFPGLRGAARGIGLTVSIAVFGGAVAMASAFDVADAGSHQFGEQVAWIPQLGVSWALGVDGLGLLMVLLATFLVPVVLLSAWRDPAGGPRAQAEPAEAERLQSNHVALVLVLEAAMIGVFAARDLFLFYVLFEAMLVPVYFLIGLFGGPRRRAAAVKFLLYGLLGGLVMLASVIALYVAGPGGPDGFLITSLSGLELEPAAERWMFLGIFLALAIKAPMWPVHTWLPDAAQQATPGTSTLLVGVLDKVGTFGMIAILLPVFPAAAAWAAPAVMVLALVSIVYGGLVAIGQSDLMRFVAFTSVSHFGFIVLGVFVLTPTALTGAGLYMLAHGLSTAALFLVGGMLTARGGSQDIGAYGGLQRLTPVLAGTFLIGGLATAALPGLSGFVPEFLVLLGTYEASPTSGVVATAGVILAAVYVLLVYQRIFTGPPRPAAAGPLEDLGARERWVVAPVVAAMLAVGFLPGPALRLLNPVAEAGVAVVGEAAEAGTPVAERAEGGDGASRGTVEEGAL